MNRYIAGILAIVIISTLGVVLFLGIATVMYGNPEHAPQSFVNFATWCLLPITYGLSVMAYKKPDSFTSFLRNIPTAITKIIQTKKLDTPTQRLFFLLLIAGVFVMAGTMVTYYLWGYTGFFSNVLLHRGFLVEYEDYSYVFYSSVAATILGLLGSFLYRQTFSRIVAWVKGG